MSDPIGDLAAEFERAYHTGQVKLLDPLPRRVRLQLWVTSRINALGCWLARHGHTGAALLLWRIFRT